MDLSAFSSNYYFLRFNWDFCRNYCWDSPLKPSWISPRNSFGFRLRTSSVIHQIYLHGISRNFCKYIPHDFIRRFFQECIQRFIWVFFKDFLRFFSNNFFKIVLKLENSFRNVSTFFILKIYASIELLQGSWRGATSKL